MLSESLHYLWSLLFTRQWNWVNTLTCNNAPLSESCGCNSLKLGSIYTLSPWSRHTTRQNLEVQYAFSFLLIRGFCHSQRLSHFAASFIVTRAEGSIAKSCKNRNSYNQKKFRYVLNRLSGDDHRFPRGESVATFESIHLQLRGLHALTVRFRVWSWIIV